MKSEINLCLRDYEHTLKESEILTSSGSMKESGLPSECKGDQAAYYACEFGTIGAQLNEDHYVTSRDSAGDGMDKDRIKFPQGQLYGRDAELKTLRSIFRLVSHQEENENGNENESKNENENEIVSENEDIHSVSEIVFLGGCSGTGKSSLVKEFIRQLKNDADSSDFFFISGKYEESKTAIPFSAISNSFSAFATDLIDGDPSLLRHTRTMLTKAGIQHGTEDARILTAIVPKLANIIPYAEDEDENTNTSLSTGIIHDISAIQHSFRIFFNAVFTKEYPMVWFLDDLQWGCMASLKLIESLLSGSNDSTGANLLFIGAYRSNEVHEEHPFYKQMTEIQSSREESKTAHKLELFNLSPQYIGNFIADSIDRPAEEIGALTEAIYGKTLGNIFFVIQAIEELVRRNVLFYDMICFQWQWGNVTQVELENCLPEDSVEMVKSKIYSLPDTLQRMLVLASHTRNTIDLETLLLLVGTEDDIRVDSRGMLKLMKLAIFEGVMLYSQKTKDYTFSHDQIREAARKSIEPGESRDILCVKIAKALLKRFLSSKDDWMLFVAVHHLNSVPAKYTDFNELSELNVRVAKLANSKSAFSEAVELLRMAWKLLNNEGAAWKTNNNAVCLQLLNDLAKTEYVLGNFDLASAAANEVVNSSASLHEKSTAYGLILECASDKDKNFVSALEKAIPIMSLYGVKLKMITTDRDVLLEKVRLKIALRFRPLIEIANLPTADDDSLNLLFDKVLLIAQFAKLENVCDIILLHMIRFAIKKGEISASLGAVSFLGVRHRKLGKYKAAYKYINCGKIIMDRFSDGTDTDRKVYVKMRIYSMLHSLYVPFVDAMATFFDLHKQLMTVGMPDRGLGSGMIGVFCFFIAGLPLKSLFEAQLLLLESSANKLGRQGFVTIFRFLRQTLKNLQGGYKLNHQRAAYFEGEVFDEDKVLGSLEGNSKAMTLRDVSTFRLQLAFIFDDENVMNEMLDRLESYPEFDSPFPRQFLRMSYTGLAALHLARIKDNNKHLKWGLAALELFKKLAKSGSYNGIPIYYCLKAMNKPDKVAFDKAICACCDTNLWNFAAMMNERCSYFLNSGEKETENMCKEYLEKAMWLYSDWGAMAKVASLKEQNPFLCNVQREKPPSVVSRTLRQTNTKIKKSNKTKK